MTWNSFSFFLNSEETETFLQLNPNILETNLVNILILIGLLVYGNKVSFSVSLENRQKEIIQTIENAQKDALNASNYYYLAEKEKALLDFLYIRKINNISDLRLNLKEINRIILSRYIKLFPEWIKKINIL